MKSLTEHYAAYERYRAASQMKPCDSMVRTFIRFCMTHYAEYEHLQQWMLDKWASKHDSEKPNSQYTRVAHVNAFIRFLSKRGLSDVVPYDDIKWHSRPKDIVFLSPEEILNFFKAINELPTNSTKQRVEAMTWTVIFRLYYSTGMRPMEARLLSVKNVDTQGHIIEIQHTKGYRQHLVALHPSMAALIVRYDDIVSQIYPQRDFFFVRGSGKGITGPEMNAVFQRLWSKYNQRHSVTYHFRHNYAIENINAWINIGYDESWDRLLCLSKSMGHSKLKETLYYYSLAPQYANELRQLSEKNLKTILPQLNNEEE